MWTIACRNGAMITMHTENGASRHLRWHPFDAPRLRVGTQLPYTGMVAARLVARIAEGMAAHGSYSDC